jgi:predicted DNA-binding transcriptional regulator AlpA
MREPDIEPDFADLPSSVKLLRNREVCELIGCSSSTVARWVKEGILPPPVQIGHASRWKSTDIDACIANLERRQVGGKEHV